MSRSKLRRLEAEAAEKARLEREGVVVLRLKMADLFAKRDSIKTKLDSPIDNIKGTVHVQCMLMYTSCIHCTCMYMYMQCLKWV